MANEFKVKNGLIVDAGGIQVTGSIVGQNGITGSIAATNNVISGSSQIALLGYAITGSNSFNGSQSITGSIVASGSLVVIGNITGSVIRATSAFTGNLNGWSTIESNGGEIRLSISQYKNGNNIVFLYSHNTDSNATKDLGFRRNTSGSLEIYDGNTADGAIINRRDLIARDITGSNAFFSGSSTITGSLGVSGSITATSYTGIHNGTINATNGVISGSIQVLGSSTVLSGSNAITIAGTSTALGGTITLATITGGSGIVSGSSQITAGSTTNFSTDVKTQLNTNTVVSGSSQVTLSSTTGYGTVINQNLLTTSDVTHNTITGTIRATNGVVSGSSQIVGSSITTNAITIAGTSTALGGTITLATITGGSGIVSGSSQVTLSSTTGYGTVINQNLLTTSDVRHNSLGVGMAASATAGRIDASGDIVAFSTSDKNFKENIVPIQNALEKISKISGNTYDWKSDMKEFHGFEGNDVGVIAQEIEEILPQLVTTRETGYKAVKYDKLVALLIEGIKEQQTQIHSLTLEIEKLKEPKGL